MKKFVQIASTKNIDVTPDLRNINSTNTMAAMPDKLSVKSAWTRFIVSIKNGIGWYPAQIKDWDSVKCLEKDGVITVGSESDTCPNQEVVEALCKKLDNAQKRFDADNKAIKSFIEQTNKNNVESLLSNITKN